MPYQLPPELLRLVVDNFRLPPFSSYRRTRGLEKEIRSTLYCLSLTSQTFRQIAQPLLFASIQITSHETLSLLVDNNAKNGYQGSIRTVHYEEAHWLPPEPGDEEEEEAFSQLFRKFALYADRIEELAVYFGFDRIQAVPVSNLKRLFLSDLRLDRVPTMPCLEVLGLHSVIINSGIQVAQSFTAVRHLNYESGDDEPSREGTAFLTCLAPQLDSIAVVSYNYPEVLPETSTLPLTSILVTLPWECWDDFAYYLELSTGGTPLVNLRIHISSYTPPFEGPSECSSVLSKIGSYFASSTQFPQLATVYLPPVDSLPSDYRTDPVISALRQLSLECQNRNIEVFYEEQSDKMDRVNQVSEEFMRRMTKKRIRREAKLSKEE
ncbi:hypothetical protein JCM5350_007573 [Sporobolomyces pararoseus]